MSEAVVRDAVLQLRLRGRHLEVAVKFQLAVLDGEERVAAPLHLVRRTAARLSAAAPLVGEENFLAVVVERRRVPEGHVGVGRGIEADRMRGVADVQQKPHAAARASGEPDFRIDRDVVTLIRAARRLVTAAWSSASASVRRRARCGGGGLSRGARARVDFFALGVARRHRQIIEDARRADDRRILRRCERHLDHFQPETRGVGIIDPAVRASRQLLGSPDR